MAEKNSDFEPPWTDKENYQSGPVTINSFHDIDRLPIFWGPGQLTDKYPDYSAPNVDEWRKFEALNIPQVVRFIYAAKKVYKKDDYNSDHNPPPPPPPAFHCGDYRYEIQNPGYFVVVKEDANVDLIYLSEPFSIGGLNSGTAGEPLEKVMSVIVILQDRDTHNEVYNGTVWGCPYFKFQPFRWVAWFRKCGTTPESMVERLIQSVFFTMERGNNPLDPPRCWVKIQVYNSTIHDWAWNGNYTSEVPHTDPGLGQDVFEWYGCSPTPP